MHARLGFAIAVNVDPQVLLIDEVLAVGDASFQPRCIDAVQRMQQQGKAILFVSHDLQSVGNLCTRAVWINDGVAAYEGPPRQTITAYLEHFWPGCTQQMQWLGAA
jgi:ABC-2 type transport system ATP-binding protein/lipopolysaccharide transport system ATP-binding protein